MEDCPAAGIVWKLCFHVRVTQQPKRYLRDWKVRLLYQLATATMMPCNKQPPTHPWHVMISEDCSLAPRQLLEVQVSAALLAAAELAQVSGACWLRPM